MGSSKGESSGWEDVASARGVFADIDAGGTGEVGWD